MKIIQTGVKHCDKIDIFSIDGNTCHFNKSMF